MAPVAFATLGAVSTTNPDALMREGTAAFDRGDYAAALDFFTRAEERTEDPGIVAYDQAACLYRLSRYRDAELHYRRCLEDAIGERRIGAAYGVGNCLVQLAQGRDIKMLTEAIRWYEQCLKDAQPESRQHADAAFNLEVAKLLLVEARKKKERGDSEKGDEGGDSDTTKPGPMQPGSEDRGAKAQAGATIPDRQPSLPTDQPPPPGAGNLPPIPDRDETVALSVEDTLRHLQKAADQIRRERREHEQQSLKGPARGVKDW